MDSVHRFLQGVLQLASEDDPKNLDPLLEGLDVLLGACILRQPRHGGSVTLILDDRSDLPL